MTIIKLYTWFTNYYDHMKSQCLVDTTNFIKTLTYFNHLLIIFAFFNML